MYLPFDVFYFLFRFVLLAFAPNNDGLNDEFSVRGFGIETISMEIYNRWGSLIHTSETYSWDGRVNNILAPDGVYTVLVKCKTNSNKWIYEKVTITFKHVGFLIFGIVIILLGKSCKETVEPPKTMFQEFSFYPNGDAYWVYSDSFSIKNENDIQTFYKDLDTFSLGNTVTKSSRFVSISNVNPKSLDTANSEMKEFIEVLGTSKRYELPNGEITPIISTFQGVSGWVRFDEDSLRVYSLKYDKNRDEYFEYQVMDFSGVSGYRYEDGMTDRVTVSYENITTGELSLTRTNYGSSPNFFYYQAISLFHYCHFYERFTMLKGPFISYRQKFELIYKDEHFKL